MELPQHLAKATKGKKASEGPGKQRLSTAFEDADAAIKAQMNDGQDESGTTVIIGGVKRHADDDKFGCYLGNAGDSRGILLRIKPDLADDWLEKLESRDTATDAGDDDEDKSPSNDDGPMGAGSADAARAKANKRLIKGNAAPWGELIDSVDHKPDDDEEMARIEAAGGFVTGGKAGKPKDGPMSMFMGGDAARLDGNLAVSRGFADYQYKDGVDLKPSEQKCSCIPDVYTMDDMQVNDLMLLACDGIFDVMSSEELAKYVLKDFHMQRQQWIKVKEQPAETFEAEGLDLGATCEEVLKICLAPPKESRDNMTMMIIRLKSKAEAASVKHAKTTQQITNIDETKLGGKLGNKYDESTMKVRTAYIDFLKQTQDELKDHPEVEASEQDLPEVAKKLLGIPLKPKIEELGGSTNPKDIDAKPLTVKERRTRHRLELANRQRELDIGLSVPTNIGDKPTFKEVKKMSKDSPTAEEAGEAGSPTNKSEKSAQASGDDDDEVGNSSPELSPGGSSKKKKKNKKNKK